MDPLRTVIENKGIIVTNNATYNVSKTLALLDGSAVHHEIVAVVQAEFAFTLLCLIPIAIIWRKHGWRSSGGWGMLLLYCCLQVVGSGLAIRPERSAQGEAFQNICIPLLLMACVGIVCEA